MHNHSKKLGRIPKTTSMLTILNAVLTLKLSGKTKQWNEMHINSVPKIFKRPVLCAWLTFFWKIKKLSLSIWMPSCHVQMKFLCFYTFVPIEGLTIKYLNCHFYQLLMPVIRYHFRKIQLNRFWKNFRNINLQPKLTRLPHFVLCRDFRSKSDTVTFTH